MNEKMFQEFDSAIQNRSETDFFRVATKIARRYAWWYQKSSTIDEDWELTADEAVLSTLELIKKTEWKEMPNFYFVCLKNRCKWIHLSLLKEQKEISLDRIMADSYGEDFSERLSLKPVQHERTYNEEIELTAVHKIIELADSFESREAVEEKLGIDHKVFCRLVSKYRIQFDTGDTAMFLEFMRVYHFYKSVGGDIRLTRARFKNDKLKCSVKTSVFFAEHYLDVFRKDRNAFIKRFVLPPNFSSRVEKVI